MSSGTLAGIYITPTAADRLAPFPQVRAVAGQGLEGDRYFQQAGSFSKKRGPDREVTLIEAEALDALQRDYQVVLQPEETRRNLVTRGVALNHLVQREFTIGEVTLRGLRLCEPCGHLERLTREGVEKGLRHRGGLRAQIVAGGTLRVGDPIRAAQPL